MPTSYLWYPGALAACGPCVAQASVVGPFVGYGWARWLGQLLRAESKVWWNMLRDLLAADLSDHPVQHLLTGTP